MYAHTQVLNHVLGSALAAGLSGPPESLAVQLRS